MQKHGIFAPRALRA